MNATAQGPTWRKRMQDLARQAGVAHPPLFAPLLFGVAAQIEAVSPQAMATDGTRIRKNVAELRRALGTDTVVCTVPSGIEAEALGVPHALDVWPPRPSGPLTAALPAEPDAARLASAARVVATLEAVKQWQADTSQPVVLAALTGPATLLAQLRAAGAALDDEAGYLLVGGTLAALGRLYAEAGVHVLQLCETAAPAAAAVDAWKGALGTIGNVARFHRVPPLLTVAADGAISWPMQVVAAPRADQGSPPPLKPHGRAWSSTPTDWSAAAGSAGAERIVLTPSEVLATHDVASLRSLVLALRER